MNTVMPLNANQISLLKTSFRRVDPNRIAALFYAKLFERNPEVKYLFPKDMEDLGSKLMSVFELVVFSFTEKSYNQFVLQESILVPLRHLGIKHDEKGIERKHYIIANQLLLEAMKEIGGTLFTEEVKEAWTLALQHLTDAMLDSSVKLSSTVEKESGVSFRDTFAYIRKRLLKQP